MSEQIEMCDGCGEPLTEESRWARWQEFTWDVESGRVSARYYCDRGCVPTAEPATRPDGR